MKKFISTSGNHAVARMAHAITDAAAIYPITPSSDMAEYYDELSSKGTKNIFDKVPVVSELQSEAGAAGTLHGLLAGGSIGTTFTASQGLFLMIPNMYKIVGELMPSVMHVSARTVASHALSIFGDHSDVMSVRSAGWAMISSSNVQEAQDIALISHLASLKASYPFLHFFDGFRTSHEINKIELIDHDQIKSLVKTLSIEKDIEAFRAKALSSAKPSQLGTAQNPDTFFQAREACNPYVAALPGVLHNIFSEFKKVTGREYKPFEYHGNPNAKQIIISMGSSVDTIKEYIGSNEKVGLINVRVYRPFDAKAFIEAIPASCEMITVLDRTKENGAVGDPLFLDVCSALIQASRTNIKVIAGRYGLASKEFTPAMVHAIYDNMVAKEPKNHFTIGINDDVTNKHLEYNNDFVLKNQDGQTECKFFGLGSDGTVGANKNSADVISSQDNMHAQAYFVYDSKKSGAVTVSHLRFSNKPILKPYLVSNPSFIACHNQSFIGKFDILKGIQKGGTFLLNTTYTMEELNKVLPAEFKRTLAEKQINFYAINAYKIAHELGLRGKINTIMQSAFFYLTNIIPYEEVVKLLKAAIDKSYGKKGQAVLDMNYSAVDSAKKDLVKIEIPSDWANAQRDAGPNKQSTKSTSYYENFCSVINAFEGEKLPVSAFNADGRVPTATSQYERRELATHLPHWIKENCIKCGICSFVCPHATVRTLEIGGEYIVQVNPYDCTGCASCANVCPSKNKALVMKDFNDEVFKNIKTEYEQSLKTAKEFLPGDIDPTNIKNSQMLKPYFEFSGACAGCGETPYIKLITQLFGDRMIIANATGCSSIYGGSSPTVPYTTDKHGRGPAWANSLFEDTAEFAYGIKLAREIQGKKDSVWAFGGDGWAYDIGYGGLDHVIAQNIDINILVMDTQVYSNTGGQSSKASPLGSIAKFTAGGKATQAKDLGAMVLNYENVYVAQIAMGANYMQTLNAIREAEAHKGPSVIIAYSTCINHGIDMSQGMKIMKNAVDSGYWTLYRRRPATDTKSAEFILDSGEPKMSYKDFIMGENRYKSLAQKNPQVAEELFKCAEEYNKRKYEKYKKLAGK